MPNSEYQELIAFLGRKFDEIGRRFEAMDQRFDSIEAKLVMHDQRFEAIETKLAEHDERFRDILGHFDQLYLRLERLEDEYHVILQALRRIERWMTDETGKREAVERGLEELKSQMAALQARIQDLEQRVR